MGDGTQPACGDDQRRQNGTQRSPCEPSRSPPSRSTAFPPVVWWLLLDDCRRELHLDEIAVLPQFLRRSGVLEKNLIDVEGVKLTFAVAVDGLRNVDKQTFQLGAVILGDHRARRPSLRLVRHGHETTRLRTTQMRRRLPDRVACDKFGTWTAAPTVRI